MSMRATLTTACLLLTAFNLPPVGAEEQEEGWREVSGEEALGVLTAVEPQVEAILQSLPELLDSSGQYCTVVLDVDVCVDEICEVDSTLEECRAMVQCLVDNLPVDVEIVLQSPVPPCADPTRRTNVCIRFVPFRYQGDLPWPDVDGRKVQTGSSVFFVPFHVRVGDDPMLSVPSFGSPIIASPGYFQVDASVVVIPCSG